MSTLGAVSYNLQLNGVRKFVSGTQSATKGAAAFNKALLGITAATTGVAFALKGLADSAGKFQEGLAAVGAVSKATAADMQTLKDAAIEAGVATQFSPQQAVDGLMSLATAGQTATQAAKTLIPVLNLTAGAMGQLTTAEAGMAIVGTMNTYGIAAENAAEVTDKLLRITQMTNFQARDFSVGLAKAAAKSNVFGQSLDDTLVVMGLLRNANIDASSAATAYTMSVQRLATDQKALNTMNKLGVSLYDKQTGKTRAFMDLVTELKPKIDQLSDATRNKALKDMFGARAIAAYNSVANAQVTVTQDGVTTVLKGADAIEHLRNNISSATGVSKEFTDALLDTFEGQKKLMAGSLETLQVVAGEEFANAFKPFVQNAVEGINEILASLRNMTPEAKRELAEQIISYTALAAKIAATMGALKLLGPVISSVNAGYRAMATALAAVKAQGFASALSTMATRAGPVASGLFNIGKALASVKVGAVAAGAALVLAANKSYNAIVRAKRDAETIEKMRSGMATDADYGRVRIGQESKGQASLRTRDRSGKVTGGRQLNLSSKPIDVASASYDQLASQLAKLTDVQEEMIRINDSGMRASLQGVVVEQGRVTKAYNISMEALEKRIQKVRKAHDAMILAEADMAAAAVAQPSVDTAAEAAMTGGAAAAAAAPASGWTEEEQRERAGRKQFETELAAIRAAKEQRMQDAKMRFLAEQRANQIEIQDIIAAKEKKRRDDAKAAAKAERDAAAKAQAEADKQASEFRTRVQAGTGAVSAAASGNLGATVGGAAAAMGSAFGPLASAGLALFDTFAGMSESGRQFKEQFGSIMGKLGEMLGPVFAALGTVLSVVIDSMKPTFAILDVSFKAIAAAIISVTIGLRELYIMFLKAVDYLPGVDLEKEITQLEKAQEAELKKLESLVKAQDDQQAATERQTEAANKAAESLSNVPSGIKIAVKSFGAMQGSQRRSPQFNDFIQRPGQAATHFSPDDTIIGVKDTGALGGGQTIVLQNVHINADNPTAFFRNLLDLVQRDHKRGGNALGGAYQGRP